MKRKIEEAMANIRLEEGARVIEQLLIECYLHPGISTKELARKLLLPVPVAAAIKRELIKAEVLVQDRGVRCTLQGDRFVEHEWGYEGLDKGLYQKLLSDGTGWKKELADVLAKLEALFQQRPQVNVLIDQSQCTAETSLARAILCLRNHALIGKRVLCVGDDDLVSVSLGLLVKRLFPGLRNQKARITVVDIDERFLHYIGEVAMKEGLQIERVQADLRWPLATELQGQYDCFFTDPPYTLQGLNLFISRGISALKQDKGLPIFLSFAHKSPDFTLEFQRELVRMGVMVREVIPQFNQYVGAEMIGNRSQMIVLRTTEHTVSAITGHYDDALYTGEVKRTQRTYQCKQCSESILVGFQSDVRTIEDLKNKGCPRCHNATFDLLDKKSV